jgi:hypothetical protein
LAGRAWGGGVQAGGAQAGGAQAGIKVYGLEAVSLLFSRTFCSLFFPIVGT